ncbi:MAG: hypothetical protein CR990_00450 [Desulfococcus sp.]|nr:MAG: hypothetical protein CR990_00450 [Desulfococcus sp.]
MELLYTAKVFKLNVDRYLAERARRLRMLTISKEIIEQNFPKYLSLIERTGEDIVITSGEMPLIKLTSLKRKHRVEDAFKDVRGKIKYHDDILKMESEEWGDI